MVPGLENTGSIVGVHHRLSCSEAYGISPDQRSNPCLLHWQENSLPPSQQGSHAAPFCEDMDTSTWNAFQTMHVASAIQKEMKAGTLEALTPVFLWSPQIYFSWCPVSSCPHIIGCSSAWLYLSSPLCLECLGSHFFFLKIFWPHCEACGILVLQPKIEPAAPALELQSLSHWTTMGVPWPPFLLIEILPILQGPVQISCFQRRVSWLPSEKQMLLFHGFFGPLL